VTDPTPYQNPLIGTRPSKIDALKHAAAGPGGPITAIAAAIVAIVTAVQTYQESRDTARVSYDTLRLAVEKNAAEIAACRQDQVNSQAWMEDMAVRFEKKTEVTDKAVARKVTRSAAPPVPTPVLEPPPKPPVAVVLPERAPLPTFEALE
jgi:hypothetical protein